MVVQVYGKPGCVQCKFTSDKLTDRGHTVEYHDISVDPESRRVVEESGRLQLPLVIAGDQRWSGFSPDRIKSLATV